MSTAEWGFFTLALVAGLTLVLSGWLHRRQERWTQEVVDALISREVEAGILAETLDRIGVRPVGSERGVWAIRRWAQERAEAFEASGGKIDPFADWGGPAALEQVRWEPDPVDEGRGGNAGGW